MELLLRESVHTTQINIPYLKTAADPTGRQVQLQAKNSARTQTKPKNSDRPNQAPLEKAHSRLLHELCLLVTGMALLLLLQDLVRPLRAIQCEREREEEVRCLVKTGVDTLRMPLRGELSSEASRRPAEEVRVATECR
ncbi:hypothetical protein BaRGS_00036209 [Batillaria attramentaria]|uniref:Uncharacterized protein n=1 Tax=Batillaria attramentaria TaxID=370345 RepID=A0ABD0JC08_9CAEN